MFFNTNLCEDLIVGILNISDDDKLIKELLNRFEKWRTLFDRAVSDGLNTDEQSGLFGELFFSQKEMARHFNEFRTVHSCLVWSGNDNFK